MRVHARDDGGDLPESLIVKGGFEEHSNSMGPMYLNEMRFYRDVQPFVAIHSPRCYFAGADPDHISPS